MRNQQVGPDFGGALHGLIQRVGPVFVQVKIPK
jgi:hypothetical protein